MGGYLGSLFFCDLGGWTDGGEKVKVGIRDLCRMACVPFSLLLFCFLRGWVWRVYGLHVTIRESKENHTPLSSCRTLPTL